MITEDRLKFSSILLNDLMPLTIPQFIPLLLIYACVATRFPTNQLVAKNICIVKNVDVTSSALVRLVVKGLGHFYIWGYYEIPAKRMRLGLET